MFDKKKALFYAIIIILGFILSWVLTCGIIYLICLCFDLTFKGSIATGIWLVFILINISISKSR